MSFSVNAFVLTGSSWPAGETEVYVNFSASNTFSDTPNVVVPGGPSISELQTAYIEAMDIWTNNSTFQYIPNTGVGFGAPCTSSFNTAIFSTTPECDSSVFGENTLAVQWTFRPFEGSTTTIKTLTVFNNAFEWDIYTGPWTGVAEFKRVAVHELGHGLGLGHSADSSAIMWFQAGNTETPQMDDLNGVAALYDLDSDGVGIASDNCPDVANNTQTDTDSDGQGDACDSDDDNDGINDTVDNCPINANAGQANFDNDSEGDVCDLDDDNDGLTDLEEINTYNTNPFNSDSDNDGLSDGDEINIYSTDPNLSDTDNDGINDGDEVTNGTDPLVNESVIIPAMPMLALLILGLFLIQANKLTHRKI